MTVWINEFHYDNAGTDAGEFIELAGAAGTNLAGWSLVLYNGNGGATYTTTTLSGTIPDQQGGFGTVSITYPENGIQNGSPDGIALVDAGGAVVQFLSYEGTFQAVGGPADGQTGEDIGVSETGSAPAGGSLHLTGTGSDYGDFDWALSADDSPGQVNAGQSFAAVVAAPVINEFVFNHTGTDTNEYIEIRAGANADLSGYRLLVIEGDAGGTGTIDRVITPGIADANGTWWTGALPQDTLENGTQTLLLVEGFSGTLGADLDTNDDGVLDLTPWTAVTDTVAISDGGATDITYAGAPVLGPNYDGVSFTPGGASRIPDGTDTGTTADWMRNDFDLAGIGGFVGTPVLGEALNTPGAANQAFVPPVGETVSVNDVTVAEGDAGTTLLTFTVTRSGNTGAFSIDYATADGSATAGSDYLAAAGTLNFAAGGVLSQTVSVTLNGDTTAEPDETFTLALSNLVNATGTTTLADGSGTGTIANDDVTLTEIGAIQGAGHKAPSVGGAVTTSGNSGATRFNVEGVVTAITTNGFWIQDADGDGDIATSDGIFVFTSAAPAATIELGETVRLLNVQASEFRLGSATNNLTVTQLTASTGTLVELGGVTAIAPVVLGVDRLLPTGIVEDDNFASFDPATDAIDFWESLEGMLVQIPDSIAVSPTSEFRTRDPNDPANAAAPNGNEEIWVRIPGNTDEASLTPAGGLILGPTDTNPERIQIDDLIPSVDLPSVDVGAGLGPVTGVVGYDFGNYEVLTGTAPVVTTPSTLVPESTALARTARGLTVATYNVENLDPRAEDPANVAGGDLYTRLGNVDDDIGSGKYAAHAAQIALNLGAPTIVALQEVQDNDGAEISSVVDATATLQALVDLIQANHGITYAFAFENPDNNQDGGQPNANIRNAFLYRADQVTLIDTYRIVDTDLGDGDAFAASRKPLVGEFAYNGVTFTIVNNHFNSKGGDNGIFGNVQPPVLSSEAQRIEQAEIVNAFVDGQLATDPTARVLVLGDLNDFAWSAPNQTLMGTGPDQVLFDLAEELLPENERYSYNFQGNAQALDHTLVTQSLLDGASVAFDIVRVNSEYTDQASDHDPAVTFLDFTAFSERLRLTSGADSVDGGAGNDRIIGRGGNDTIAGGEGNDVLFGNAGRDVFVFAPGGGIDRVADFQKGLDRLDFTAFADLGVDGIEDLRIVETAAGVTRVTVEGVPGLQVRLSLGGAVLEAGDFLFA